MDKKKQIIIGAIVVIIVFIIGIAITKINIGNSSNAETKSENAITTVQNQEETTLDDDEYPTVETHTEDANAASTNYFDNVDVVEETTKKGKKNKKNQESEAYPGENDGWSPLVSPDDLEQ